MLKNKNQVARIDALRYDELDAFGHMSEPAGAAQSCMAASDEVFQDLDSARFQKIEPVFSGSPILALEFSAELAFNSFSKGFRYDMKTANHARWRLSKMMSGVPGNRTSEPTRPDRAPAGSDEVS